MKLFRLLTTLLLLALIGVFVQQNLSTFRTVLPFTLDLHIREQVKWSHQVSTLLVLSAVLGFLLGFGAMLRPYLRMRRASRQKDEPLETALTTRPLISRGKVADASADQDGRQPAAVVVENPASNPANPA